ncbi:MAG: methionine adenosyltransferase [Geminicoccus sp.]|nr:methionine adenosyltransferase [Geminicoccus sp.]MAF00562.1 methionine adenosyltransferase [Geminicoccus sp.]
MSMSSYVFTSESVSEGHPDKVCDQISDAVVDLFLSRNPEARVGVETLTTTNRVVLAGEVRGDVSGDEMIAAARDVIRRIGYEQDGFHWQNAAIDCYVHGQSADIAQGVDEGEGLFTEEGAGDQGIMFGYACTETPALMPAPIQYAHEILQRLSALRKGGEDRLGPDAKSQVTLVYENGVPVATTNVVVSTQHSASATQDQIRDIVRGVVSEVLPEGWMPSEDSFYCNPTGQFIIGGPDGDAGLTGRKIIVDTYGGAAPHGGGAFSGKDPTKVDRSAAYAARYLAKNVVAAGLAERCTIQLSYAIGVAQPLSIFVNTDGTGTVDDARIGEVVGRVMDLRPKGIRTHLGLNRPIYERTAAYGHFGRTPDDAGGFSWERTDLIDAIKAELS